MKYSKYNVAVKASENKWVIYNLLSEALMELDEEHFLLFNSCLKNADQGNCSMAYDLFVSNGFLIDDDYDEIDFIRFANRKYCTLNDSLQLTIAPTMDCNCSCVYCFETPHHGRMDTTVQQAVIDFIKHQHQIIKNDFIHIDWFGGEPLLCWDTITAMSKEIISYSDSQDITYSSGIITNGTLLNSAVVQEMIKCRISTVQITIDGSKKVHDSRRVFRGGQGTYETIMSNLNFFKDSGIDVTVRVNIDKTNLTALEDVSKAIAASGFKCNIYPAQVECFSNTDTDCKRVAMNPKEFAKDVKEEYLLKTPNPSEKPARFLSCQAQKTNSYGIDEKGYLYKCWNELGMPERAFGNVFDYPKKICGKNLVRFTGHDFIGNPECLECKVLPICMGGCANLRYANNELPCIAEKFCLESYVLNLWSSKKKGATQ